MEMAAGISLILGGDPLAYLALPVEEFLGWADLADDIAEARARAKQG